MMLDAKSVDAGSTPVGDALKAIKQYKYIEEIVMFEIKTKGGFINRYA